MSTRANGYRPRLALVAPTLESAYPLRALLERGWDVQVVADGWNASGHELAEELPSERVHDPLRSGSRPTRAQAAISVARATRRRPLARWREIRSPSRRTRIARALTIALAPRVVQVPSGALAHSWSGVAHAIGACVVVTVTSDEAIAMSFQDQHSPLPASALHVESDSVASLLNGASRGDTVGVISPAPDPALLVERKAEPWAKAPLRILGIGPLSWTQGYEHALLALKLLSERGVPFQYRIVGRGEYRDPISFARHQLRLDSSVELIEPRSRAELRDLLRWASVLVDASVAATSPKPVLDAYACGVPVVTTDRAAHGGAALRIRRRDPKGLCEALVAIASDSALRARLAQAGRKRALQAPSEAEQAERFDDLYLRALAQGASNRVA